MNDRELLELAAKAAGMNTTSLDGWTWCSGVGSGRLDGLWKAHWPTASEKEQNPRSIPLRWNPLTDDGDALRLAVKLCIQIQPYEETQAVWAHTQKSLGIGSDGYHSYQAGELMREAFGEDKDAATRRAIVRAAAAIGEAMP